MLYYNNYNSWFKHFNECDLIWLFAAKPNFLTCSVHICMYKNISLYCVVIKVSLELPQGSVCLRI